MRYESVKMAIRGEVNLMQIRLFSISLNLKRGENRKDYWSINSPHDKKRRKKMKKTLLSLLILCLLFVVGVCTSYAADGIIYGCTVKSTGLLRIVSSPADCKNSETAIQIAAPTEIPRVVSGSVDADGTIVNGTGFTAAPPTLSDPGFYTISFSPSPFTTTPTCVVSSYHHATACTPYSTTESELVVDCTFLVINAPIILDTPVQYQPSNSAFNFICIQ